MERHKKKNKKMLDSLTLKAEVLKTQTQDTESDDELGASFDELSPELNLDKQRKDATLLKQSVQDLLTRHNNEVKKNKWQAILDQYNHKNFVSYVPLPKTEEKKKLSILGRKKSKGANLNLRRSSTLDNPREEGEEGKEMDLEAFVNMTSSEKNIKVSDTLKLINKIT